MGFRRKWTRSEFESGITVPRLSLSLQLAPVPTVIDRKEYTLGLRDSGYGPAVLRKGRSPNTSKRVLDSIFKVSLL